MAHAWASECKAKPDIYPADAHMLEIKIEHFELMYHAEVHYDCIVNQDTNRVSTTPPP